MTPPKLILVGEAYGDEEVKAGEPFVGPAGRLLEGVLEEVGLRRGDCLITNLLNEQPTPAGATSPLRNDFGALYEDKGRRKPLPRLVEAVRTLYKTIVDIPCSTIVALGNEPLRWLAGKEGIGNWRGSVLPDVGMLGKKVLPTYHPAAVLRQWSWRPLLVCDLRKALTQAAFPEIQQQNRAVHVYLPQPRPTYSGLGSSTLDDLYRTAIHVHEGFDRALEALQALQGGRPVAFDIETERFQANSLALAPSATEAHVWPFFRGTSGSFWPPEEEAMLWEAVRALFQTTPTLGQNVHYDLTFLQELGIWPAQLTMDTMVAFHTLYPELPKRLEFLTSLYTDLPYYKGLGEDPNAYVFWAYNGLDAMTTWECSQALEQELKETLV